MTFLLALALAHQRHEGWFPGSLSWRNSNPGNLRLSAYQQQAYGAVPGDGGFARFPTYDAGLQALEDDLRAKITGHSSHIDYSKNPTFLDMVKVYAPAADSNDPVAYCGDLCTQLSGYGITPRTPLSVLAGLLNADAIVPVQTAQQQLEIAHEAVPRVRGVRLTVLLRRIARLLKITGG